MPAYAVPIVISFGAVDEDVDVDVDVEVDVDEDPQAAANNDIAAKEAEIATVLERNSFIFSPSVYC